MSNLTEIAKENGAKDTLSGKFVITHAQLQATVEQVCKPLVEALELAKHFGDLLDANSAVNNAISNYRKLMGQDK